jgi:hypothetical protein
MLRLQQHELQRAGPSWGKPAASRMHFHQESLIRCRKARIIVEGEARGTAMEKNKIAESIIIRVGGGIREVYRKPANTPDEVESSTQESSVEKPDAAQIFQPEYEPTY